MFSSPYFTCFLLPRLFCTSCLADPGSLYFIQQRSIKLMQYFVGDLRLFKTATWEQGFSRSLGSQHILSPLLLGNNHLASPSCKIFFLKTTNHLFLSEPQKSYIHRTSIDPVCGLWQSWKKSIMLETWWLPFPPALRVMSNRRLKTISRPK